MWLNIISCAPFNLIVRRFRASCLIRTRRGLIFHLFHFSNASPLYFHHLTVTNNHLIHAQQDGLVEWPYKNPGNEPRTTVEISSTEITPVHLPSRRTCLCSGYNSGEDATTTPVSSEVDEKRSIGRLASPLLMQKGEACTVPARIYHSTGESSMSSSSQIRSAGRLVATHTQKRKSGRNP